jgi:hypothetical protein
MKLYQSLNEYFRKLIQRGIWERLNHSNELHIPKLQKVFNLPPGKISDF